jgi:hypothetical protein
MAETSPAMQERRSNVTGICSSLDFHGTELT